MPTAGSLNSLMTSPSCCKASRSTRQRSWRSRKTALAPANFHKKLRVAPALVGQGDRPYLFTDAWVISKANCDADCQSTAKIFLNWQRLNWAQLITLGADLTPQRPRYLAIAYQPFYNSDDLSALAHQAQDYYLFFNQEINRAVSQDTMKFWDNEDSQSASLQQLVSVGYTP